ncbi:hypothetical protein [Rhizobium sp. SGZ-381]|uniref:hypothetical protein n=1 Tax=Rhizobium sp. SGZ-381 TaxID=3342800 RepID=UPI003672D3BA
MKVRFFPLTFALLTGCADLSAVSDISKNLKDASSAWGDVGAELAASCKREIKLNPSLTNCSVEIAASAGLAQMNDVLSGYFQALGDVAAETKFTIKPGLDKATAAVAKIPKIDSDRVKAVSGVVALLTKLANEGARERTVQDLIENGAPPARKIIGGLDSLLAVRLIRQLETERTQLTSQFSTWIASERGDLSEKPEAVCSGSKASTFNGPGYLLSLEYCRQLDVINGRIKAVESYRQSLKKADAALAELQSTDIRFNTKALAKNLYAIGSEIHDDVAAIRKAFD